jgi:hypothetical protein
METNEGAHDMNNLIYARKQTPDGSLFGMQHGQMIRQFTPNWFAMTMGTGIVFLILLAAPVEIPGRHWMWLNS